MRLDLKALRKRKKLSQTQLGELLGVSMRTIQNWEKEINDIPFKKVVEISKILDFSIYELVAPDDTNDKLVEEPQDQLKRPDAKNEAEIEYLTKRVKELESLNAELQKALIKAMDKL